MEARTRTHGRPPSDNGASSFHLFWELGPHGPLVEVSAVLEILEPPAVDDLYFWALQVDFVDRGRSIGGAHTGLQWNRDFPGRTAVNWGGYQASALGGGELPGSASMLPGPPSRANTRNYPWRPQRAYRLRVYRSPETPGAWRADIRDEGTGEVSIMRDLYTGGSSLASPMVWSEVFANCSAPSVTVRWSQLLALEASGRLLVPHAVRVTYQSFEDGGCTNTTALRDDQGILQVTNTARVTRQGSLLVM